MGESTPANDRCTILRASVWSEDEDGWREGIAEALYGPDDAMLVVSDWGPIEEPDWRHEGCDAVERRHFLYDASDEPDWPPTIDARDRQIGTLIQ